MKARFLQTRDRAAAIGLAIVLVLATVASIGVTSMINAATNTVTITSSSGWLESAYATWSPVTGAKSYNVYVKGASEADSKYVKVDDELIRSYGNYYRVDAVGLAAGNYTLKVEAVLSTSKISATTNVSVSAHDRSGFAWVNGEANGAYNSDGTLKSNAVVLYVTEDTKNTVTMDVVTDSKGTKTTSTGIQNILYSYKKGYEKRPLDIRLIGKVTDAAVLEAGDLMISGSGDSKRISCGITLEGIGEDATAYGWGIRIKNASNVEVRNIGIMLVDSSEGDNVGLQQSDDHIWVHNCDFFYGMAGSDADQAKGDGALDCKKSTYITFSYNHFYDNGKCNLLGLSEGTTNDLYITYHHNWYDHSDSRHPRVRYYSAHVYNNYYDGNAKYGIGACLGSSIFSEGNYFRNCKYPMMTSMQGSDVMDWANNKRDVTNLATFSKEDGGSIKAYNNYMEGQKAFVSYQENKTDFDAYVASSAKEKVPSTVKSYAGGNTYNNFDTSSIMYSYTADSPANAKSKVTTYAGRVNGGDFKFTFSSDDDASYSVNTALMNALKSYRTSLVGVGGGSKADSSATQATTKATQATTQATQATTKATQATTKATEAATKATEVAASTGSVYAHNFTKDGLTDSFFTIAGNTSTSKGTVKYNGLTLTTCLKIESATKITFNASTKGELVLVFNDGFAGSILVDGSKVTASNGVLTKTLSAGTHTITKADTCNLYYISFTGAGTTQSTTQATTKAQATTQATTQAAQTPSVITGDIYVSPNGKSGNKGTITSPLDLKSAIESVQPGNTIWMQAGTYKMYDMYKAPIVISENNSGRAGAYKKISSIDGGTVTLDFAGMAEDGANRGIVLDGDYWHFYGIDITNAGDNGMLLSGNNNILELCQFYGNHDTGLQLSRYNTNANSIAQWPSYNTILNCTAYNNKDLATCENADGFAAKLTCGEGNVFDGCISYCNSDDGWDLYAKPATGSIGVVTLKNCVAFGNGKLTDGTGSANGDMNGFKLGGSNGAVPTAHVITNCLAFNNGATGFTDNGNGGAILMSNCTAVNNGKYDSTKANFSCYRTNANAKYTNLLTFSQSSAATDSFYGKMTHIIYNYNKVGTYYVSSFNATGAKFKYTGADGKDYTVSNNDFESVSIPGYNASTGAYTLNYHKIFRNSDGSINLGGLYEIKKSSPLYTAGENKAVLGAVVGTQRGQSTSQGQQEKPTQAQTEAETQATQATTKATQATTKATQATTKATEATTKATQAETKATQATTKATEATTKATEATTKATEAQTTAASGSTKTVSVTMSGSTIDLSKYADKKITKLSLELSATGTGSGAAFLKTSNGGWIGAVDYSIDNTNKITINLSNYSGFDVIDLYMWWNSAGASIKNVKITYAS